jgi:protein phosphatase 2C family protein 2/3
MSCAVVVVIIDRNCYVANVGDSRAIMSLDHGRRTIALSNDHKPNCSSERSRILMNGGTVYQSMITTKGGQSIPGPYRVNPGRLSVSRALGDIQAKDEKYEGLAGVLIS